MTNAVARLGRVFRLPPRRWAGMARVAANAILVEWSLRHEPLPRTAGRLGVGTGDPSGRESAALLLTIREREAVDDVRRVISRRPFNGTCLRQALLVGHALRERRPVLQVGVRKDTSEVRAHAWLVVDGVVVDDFAPRPRAAAGFVVMPIDLDEAGLR
ncbi:lasso peptide biosynthesis B2 protein [Propionicicella superfundia]|uniref:lasso peptide biosynthesis B2 protein n=1 Tax=Propionicicella superfundia TaxID=348582 RepID=UPI000404C581|nr:lasso peptide biosynthesis B2 protein [Propionicicella superfundia]